MNDLPLTAPTLSICIPTYNRRDYLEFLLNGLTGSIRELHYSFEIVISDNDSTDGTEDLVARFASALPIRYFKRDRNYGSHENLIFVLHQALGQFQLYLADDDGVIFSEVNKVLHSLVADPGIGVVYAPCVYFDYLTNELGERCYDLPDNHMIGRGRTEELLNFVLQHHIVPEHFICRRDVFLAIHPRMSAHTYWAFVHATDYVLASKVLFHKGPLYKFHTRNLAGTMPRDHVGWADVRMNWDQYRGGLEYMMSRIGSGLDQSSMTSLALQIQSFIAKRISIALLVRLRLNSSGDIFECYYLACRLKAMGHSYLSPISPLELATRAGLMFLCTDDFLLSGVTNLVCVGHFDQAAQEYVRAHSRVPVSFVDLMPIRSESTSSTLFCLAERAADNRTGTQLESERIVWFENLLLKFS